MAISREEALAREAVWQAEKENPIEKSQTTTLPPILGCFLEAIRFLGGNPSVISRDSSYWVTRNELQEKLVKDFVPLIPDTKKQLSDDEFKGITSRVADEINEFLAKEGFDIRLDQIGADEFGVASVLKVLVEWKEAGQETYLTIEGNNEKRYPAVRLSEKDWVTFYRNDIHSHPIARVETKSGDVVWMTIHPARTDTPFDVIEFSKKDKHQISEYNELVFPMVDYDQEVDISWIQGLSLMGWRVVQALQQTKFRMNEIGAKVESAAAMKLFRCITQHRRVFKIDGPMLLWIERPGLDMPLMSGIFTSDDWKKPEEL